MASKRINMDSASSASCSKKVKKYKTRYSKEWKKKFDFIQACAKSVVGYGDKFHWVCCNVDISCAAGGANDVLKHQEIPKHIERKKSIKGKNLVLFFVFTTQIPCRLVSNKHVLHEILTSFPNIFSLFFGLKVKGKKDSWQKGGSSSGNEVDKIKPSKCVHLFVGHLLSYKTFFLPDSSLQAFLRPETPTTSSMHPAILAEVRNGYACRSP